MASSPRTGAAREDGRRPLVLRDVIAGRENSQARVRQDAGELASGGDGHDVVVAAPDQQRRLIEAAIRIDPGLGLVGDNTLRRGDESMTPAGLRERRSVFLDVLLRRWAARWRESFRAPRISISGGAVPRKASGSRGAETSIAASVNFCGNAGASMMTKRATRLGARSFSSSAVSKATTPPKEWPTSVTSIQLLLLDERGDKLRLIASRIGRVGRLVRAAEALEIDRDDAMGCGELRRDLTPREPRHAEAVQQQDRRADAPFLDVQPNRSRARDQRRHVSVGHVSGPARRRGRRR